MGRENPYGKSGDETTRQIIERVIGQHFKSDSSRERTIGEMEDEMASLIANKAQVVDFSKGESCEFK